MNLPYMNEIRPVKRQIVEFRGYNHNTTIGEGEFYQMSNLSSDYYPALAVRKKRKEVKELVSPNGLFAKDEPAWVDGTGFYYNGIYKGSVTDGAKQFVSMGAYLLIFPDRKYYNTFDNTFGSLEAHTYISSTITIQACQMDGTLSDPASSMYVKISAAGIGSGFKQYDGITISGCVIEELNKTVVITKMETGYIIIPGKILSNRNQSGGLSIDRKVPEMDFLTESENRIWGCSSAKHEIYASKLGDPFNWNCYEGISTDSYAATVGSDGDFTGATTFLGYVMFFKENCIHKVYGSKPSNYQIFENAGRGIAKGSEKSVAIVNETMYYLSRNGVVAYAGGFPASVSDVFGDVEYINGVGGALGNKYYISMYDGNVYHLFAYDEKLGLWFREDNTHATYFANCEGKLYYIDADTKKLVDITGNDTGTINWSAEFSDTDRSMYKKYVSKIQFKLELEENAVFSVHIMYDNNGRWEKVATASDKAGRSYNIPVSVRRCDSYKLKLSGTGMCKIYTMVKTYSEGSDY